MNMRLSTSLVTVFLVSLFSVPVSHAAVQSSVKIEQVSPTQYGTWTFLYHDGSSIASTDAGIDPKNHVFTVTQFTPMTISVVPPAGMSAKISIYRNGDLTKSESSQQFSFTPYANESYRFIIQYSYSRMGSVGVTSTPTRLRFRMKGPTPKNYTAVTPFTFKNIPAGRYTLYFPSTENCASPAPYGVSVEPEKRVTANVSLICSTESLSPLSQKPLVSRRAIIQSVENRENRPRGQRK